MTDRPVVDASTSLRKGRDMASSRYGYRLPSGGLIDRSRTISFKFNDRPFTGHPGDTLASALIANGVNLIGRSFKYHRPRGFYGVGLEDPNSMLAVQDAYGYEPALRAGQMRLCEGLEARSVTGWPSVSFDLAAGVQPSQASWPPASTTRPLNGRPGQCSSP
jgi:sarcosine oxidase subunit alpha